jgi:hypothetical protein
LTPEQALELRLYHRLEPFGEVRSDLRMAHAIRFYYDSKRGKKGKSLTLGELTLYPDLAEEESERASDSELRETLGKFAEIKSG